MGELQNRMVMVMRLRNYSAKTVKSYLSVVRGFVRMYGKSPTEMGEEEVRHYLQSLVERGRSWGTIRQATSVLKFLYVETLGRGWKIDDLPRSRREKRLPLVLSIQEVKRIIEAVTNLKHRTALMTCYSAGLRVSEVVHLKVADIDSERMQIRVEQGKGKKDRYTLLANSLLDQLRLYWRVYRPQEWLFAGMRPGTPYSVRSVQQVFMRAKKKRGSRRLLPFIPFGIVLRRICWNPASIFSSFRDYLVIQA
jgi:site-specific recombinase XerD